MNEREEIGKIISVEDYKIMIMDEMIGIKSVKFAKYIYDFIKTAKKYWR